MNGRSRPRQQLRDGSDQGVGPVRSDLSRLAVGGIALAKNAVADFRSRFLDKNTSMTCPYWSTAR
jgi:hypothetical protein